MTGRCTEVTELLKEKSGLFVDFEFLTEMGSWDRLIDSRRF